MKTKKYFLLLVALSVILSMTLLNWETVNAKTRAIIIKRSLVAGQTLILRSGRGGVYFYKPAYTGTAVITRTEPVDTRQLAFTKPWVTIELFDTKGSPIITVKGLTYVFYDLDKEERGAWDDGRLKVYQFNSDKQVWQKCETQYLAELLGNPHGRVMCQVARTYMTYGLASRR